MGSDEVTLLLMFLFIALKVWTAEVWFNIECKLLNLTMTHEVLCCVLGHVETKVTEFAYSVTKLYGCLW